MEIPRHLASIFRSNTSWSYYIQLGQLPTLSFSDRKNIYYNTVLNSRNSAAYFIGIRSLTAPLAYLFVFLEALNFLSPTGVSARFKRGCKRV